jgi:hypothetical protein
MMILDFAFLDPNLNTRDFDSDNFFTYIRESYRDQTIFRYDLLSMRKSQRAKLNSVAVEFNLKVDDYLTSKSLLSSFQILDYVKDANKIVKHNIKLKIMKETLYLITFDALPFANISSSTITELNKSLQYRFTRALESF